ncbi:type IV pilus assembly protein PilM [Candidatus Sumerlaeota bacterium]|nr:type IV pilus assembly protein PilM [Candidatus Sumerlaeota bacterium]
MAFWSRPAVGLDIGSRYVKAVQLKKTGKNIELERFGVSEIYAKGEKPSSPDDQRQAVVQAVRRAFSEAGITANQIVSAVAGESIIVRYIQLPEMPEEELANALRWEAEEYIPFRIEDVNIDSAIIGHSAQGDTRRIDVLVVCARKDLINDHVALVREAGVTPTLIDVDSFAFLNCFEVNYSPDPQEVVGLVNIGGDITSISVYLAGMPRFSRDISIGGNTITAAIQQRLEVPISQAETVKIDRGVGPLAAREAGPASEGPAQGAGDSAQPGSPPVGPPSTLSAKDAQADRAIRNTLNNLIGEIRRSIQFFENQSGGKTVSRVVIGGGSASMRGLDAFIQRELQLPVEIIDPLRSIPVTGKNLNADTLRESRHMLSVGIGLALRKVMG